MAWCSRYWRKVVYTCNKLVKVWNLPLSETIFIRFSCGTTKCSCNEMNGDIMNRFIFAEHIYIQTKIVQSCHLGVAFQDGRHAFHQLIDDMDDPIRCNNIRLDDYTFLPAAMDTDFGLSVLKGNKRKIWQYKILSKPLEAYHFNLWKCEDRKSFTCCRWASKVSKYLRLNSVSTVCITDYKS